MMSTLVFSMHLPTTAVPRIVAMVNGLRDQGFIVSATLTRGDESMSECPLCGRVVTEIDDLHEHG